MNKWISDLRRLGYANTTVVKVLSMILTDAADEHLIPANPIRRYRRRGRRSHRIDANASGQHPQKYFASQNKPPHSAATPPDS